MEQVWIVTYEYRIGDEVHLRSIEEVFDSEIAAKYYISREGYTEDSLDGYHKKGDYHEYLCCKEYSVLNEDYWE